MKFDFTKDECLLLLGALKNGQAVALRASRNSDDEAVAAAHLKRFAAFKLLVAKVEQISLPGVPV